MMMQHMKNEEEQIVFTNKAKCQDCNRCVRVCPIKAIKMENGQASVIAEKCISCGTCIKECPQNAKIYRKDIIKVKQLLDDDCKVAISCAPSFAAVYDGWRARRLPSALRALGFDYIAETATGAYQVAYKTREFVENNSTMSWISSACPAVVNYIEKYDPEMIDNLVPIVSPMIAHAIQIKKQLGNDYKIVFVGPCIAKKYEAERSEYQGYIDAVITFEELDELFEEEEINLKILEDSFFDETPGKNSRLFALSGGFSKTADLDTDLLSAEIISASDFDDIEDTLDLVKNSSKRYIIEPLFCRNGCINGPGICSETNIFSRRSEVLDYSKQDTFSEIETQDINAKLRTEFAKNEKIEEKEFPEDEILKILEKIGKDDSENQLNCTSCGYPSCRDKAIAVLKGMAEIEMCVPYMRQMADVKNDKIIESSPNGIVILDEKYRILNMNTAFRKFFMCSKSVCGKPISYLFDPEPFIKLMTSDNDHYEITLKHEKYNLVTHQIVYRLREEKKIVGIYVNITDNLSDKNRLEKMRSNTIRKAEELLNHQIEMAQNIAKLLGESTAQGEELLANLLRFSDDEQGEIKNAKDKWLWDMYTSK